MKQEPIASSSPPCMLAERHRDIIWHEPAPESHALLSGLSHCFGIHLSNDSDSPQQRFVSELGGLFQKCRVDAETDLERHNRPWGNVYLIQHGVLRLFRESLAGKVAIHHFFTEGDLIWPVFGRSRTSRNTLCLTAVTPATLWVADFSSFRAAVQAQGDGAWEKFAIVLTEEVAELTSMREFRKQTMPAQERYRLLLDEYPELIKRVPDNQLASWLGVVPATFSRLKKATGNGRSSG